MYNTVQWTETFSLLENILLSKSSWKQEIEFHFNDKSILRLLQHQQLPSHTVQKLIVISNKFPRTFDSILLSYVIDAYWKCLKKWHWTNSFWVEFWVFLMNNTWFFCKTKRKKNKKKFVMTMGFEPRSSGWKSRVLTSRPSGHLPYIAPNLNFVQYLPKFH